MKGNCNLGNVIYQANISLKEGKFNNKVYIGVPSLKWKFRYYNHRKYLNGLLFRLPYINTTGNQKTKD